MRDGLGGEWVHRDAPSFLRQNNCRRTLFFPTALLIPVPKTTSGDPPCLFQKPVDSPWEFIYGAMRFGEGRLIAQKQNVPLIFHRMEVPIVP